MKNIFILFCIFLLTIQLETVHAQTTVYHGKHAAEIVEGATTVRTKGEEQFLTYFAYAEGKQPPVADFIEYFKAQYGIDNTYTFQLIDRQVDHLGQEHLRYQQFYNGIPIRLAHVGVHIKAGKVLSLSGFFYKIPMTNTEVSISETAALDKAMEVVPADKYKWELAKEEAFLKNESGNASATYYPEGELYYISENLKENTEKQKLCYRFDIYAHEPLVRKHVYVDANNGKVVFQEDIIKHADVTTSATTAYNGVRTIVVDSVSPKIFRLRENSRGDGIETYNLNGGEVYADATDFVDSTNSWSSFNPAIDQYAIDAHWGAEMTYDYYIQKHNRNSINNQGFALKSYIHYKKNYVNAFWDGQRMTYGDGDNATNPLTAIDIIGHEITHGLTRFTSDLLYAKESGALNESFSDIFGLAIEKYALPNNWNWTMGEDIGRTLRSFSNPKKYRDPDTYGGTHWISQKNCSPDKTNDKCGVHTNSGVQNYWFYLLSVGGTGINDLGDSINVVGIGVDSAAAIAFRSNTIYLTPSSDYEDARYFSFRAAVDLYGACSPAVASTLNAWHAVGVGDKYIPDLNVDFFAVNDTAFCKTPAEVAFKNKGSNVYNFEWDFGDGSTSSLPEPTHMYAAPGNYTVTLYADGLACGKDTVIRQDYIQINNAFQCSFTLNGNAQTKTDCQGRFYDSGGLNGKYSNNQADTLYIQPTDADQILFEFTHLDVEEGTLGYCNLDYVEIFDGPTTKAPSLGRFCNSILPPDSILSTSSTLTVVFYSDRYVAKRGFGARWKCLQSTVLPQADFETSIDTSCDGKIKFFNRSLNGVSDFYWDFGDGNTSTLRDPEHLYLDNGDYTVKLTVENSHGWDSVIKNSIVNISRLPASIVNNDTVCLNGEAKLGLETQTSNKWYASENDDTPYYVGKVLTLKELNETKHFYVENVIEYPKQNFVPLSMGGSSYYSDSSAALYFDVSAPLILESVVLYSDVARDRIVEVRNSKGKVVQSKSVYVPSSALQVTLNFVLYPDTGYSISIADRDPSLQINTTGASFPYVENGLISINRSSLGGDIFPFFYYWTVKQLNCVSERKKVTAFVDTTCVVTALDNLNMKDDGLTVYPNPFATQFKIDLPKSDKAYTFYLYDTNGRLIYKEKSTGSHQQHLIKTAGLSNGVYFLKIEGQHKIYQKKLIKHNDK